MSAPAGLSWSRTFQGVRLIFDKALLIDYGMIASFIAYLSSPASVTELFSERNVESHPVHFHHLHSFVSFSRL